jgi:hypothetical protein
VPRARGDWWCVSKATSCRLWLDRYNLQGADFGASQYIYWMKHKSETFEKFKEFQKEVKNQLIERSSIFVLTEEAII